MLDTRHSAPSAETDLSKRIATFLITVAGSAGAFQPLRELLATLPETLNAAVVLMLHTGLGSSLADTFARRSRLRVQEATSGMLLRTGCAYVAPAGQHIIVNPDARLTISAAPRLRFFRPSADWLFESAAASFGERHLAIVLSGVLSDGAQQIRTVKRSGGTVLVQCPSDALYAGMPSAAIATDCADRVLPLGAMINAIVEVVAARNAIDDARFFEWPFGHEPPR